MDEKSLKIRSAENVEAHGLMFESGPSNRFAVCYILGRTVFTSCIIIFATSTRLFVLIISRGKRTLHSVIRHCSSDLSVNNGDCGRFCVPTMEKEKN